MQESLKRYNGPLDLKGLNIIELLGTSKVLIGEGVYPFLRRSSVDTSLKPYVQIKIWRKISDRRPSRTILHTLDECYATKQALSSRARVLEVHAS